MSEEPKKKVEHKIEISWCKSCGICVELCPRAVLSMKDQYPVVTNIEACIACKLCELRCPDFAIRVLSNKTKPENKPEKKPEEK